MFHTFKCGYLDLQHKMFEYVWNLKNPLNSCAVTKGKKTEFLRKCFQGKK